MRQKDAFYRIISFILPFACIFAYSEILDSSAALFCTPFFGLGWILGLSTFAQAALDLDCWQAGFSPEICCQGSGSASAQLASFGNPLCWDAVFTYEKCCTETVKGRQFQAQRASFIESFRAEGAIIEFKIVHIPGTTRSGAVATRNFTTGDVVLKVDSQQIRGIENLPYSIKVATEKCDAHVKLATAVLAARMGKRSNLWPAWFPLLPKNYSNSLYFTERQKSLVRRSFFGYLIDNWEEDLECMKDAAQKLWPEYEDSYEDRRWAFSVVKTRGFSFEGTREKTLLVPLADFLNHKLESNVGSHPDSSTLSFIARRNITEGEELCIEYGRASNLEFMVRYGFRSEFNSYGGREFDLEGEFLQSKCPSVILKHDDNVVEAETLNCHRRARYRAFGENFGQAEESDLIQEDRSIYHTIAMACQSLIPSMIDQQKMEEMPDDNELSLALIQEIQSEMRLAQRCSHMFFQMSNQTTILPFAEESPLKDVGEDVNSGKKPIHDEF